MLGTLGVATARETQEGRILAARKRSGEPAVSAFVKHAARVHGDGYTLLEGFATYALLLLDRQSMIDFCGFLKESFVMLHMEFLDTFLEELNRISDSRCEL